MLAKITRLFPVWAILLSAAACYTPALLPASAPGLPAADADHVRNGRHAEYR